MRTILICLLMSVLPSWAQAAIVQLEMRQGISASAEYLVGQRNKPAVLLLHGFLQTREFATVSTLARGLHDAGYTVLSPTLSLGIPGRKQSLACEAVHRHSLDDDIAEVARWIAWLKSRGHRSIVLVGHSFGSLQLLAYLEAHHDKSIKAFIGASLVEAQIDTPSRPALVTELESRAASKQRSLVTHALSYCRKYTSTPAELLSYVRWDQSRTLAALKALPVRVQLIMGDHDEILGRDWIKALNHVGTPMIIVKGANHFMDGAHEFDLLEHALDSLERIDKAPAQ